MDGIRTHPARQLWIGGPGAKPVVVYLSPSSEPMFDHERATLEAVARRIARVENRAFAGLYRDGRRCGEDVFFVPDEALRLEEAVRLGIRSSRQLFGGIVPHAFVGTKAITHGLVNAAAERPDGWSPAFADRVRDVVLPGFTVFSARDAMSAAKRLADLGAIRVKPTRAAGGSGQGLASSEAEVASSCEGLAGAALQANGLVLETNLCPVTTLSLGQVTLGELQLSYYGVQRTAINNAGQPVYGGSDLVCARGGWDALDRLPLSPGVRLAMSQARRYDAATSEYSGFIASRRNYDVAQGIDGAGVMRSGVLESSWRSGGASTAELAALELFAVDPELFVVRACSVKQFGTGHEPPHRAEIHFHADDPRDGRILRYTVVTHALRRVASSAGDIRQEEAAIGL